MGNKKKIKQYNKQLSDLKLDYFMVGFTAQRLFDKEIASLEKKIKQLEESVSEFEHIG